MILDGRITDAIRESGIRNVMLVDDAFDVPALDAGEYGPLFEFLESAVGKALATELGISEEVLAAALDQMSNDEFAEDEIRDVISRMHREYIVARDPRFDPDAIFSSRLSNNLSDVDPLISVLKRCKGVTISLVGRHTPDPDWSTSQFPDLIFADFYLDGEITSTEDFSQEAGEAAKSSSLKRLAEMLKPASDAKKHPSVVLMSSKDVRAQAEGYRRSISDEAGSVFASRFGFIQKSDLVPIPKADDDPPQKPQSIEIRSEAAEVLLDIIQSHPFGSKLYDALTFWLDSAEKGRLAMKADIEQLTLKEFAYLVTFRLAKEGIGLFEYMEWFFGECLLGAIGEVTADAKNRPQMTKLDKHASLIEGGYEKERTGKIAELYHRARIDRRPATKTELRLGDLYLKAAEGENEASLWAVLTPDCDLVPRDGKMAAERILTVKGRLIPYDAPKSSLSEFIIINKAFYSVDWKLKDMVTRPDLSDLEFVGTLRPIYAQDLQRKALQDLGRIGLAVAPVIRMDGTFKLKIVRNGKIEEIGLGEEEMGRCEIYPSRGGSDTSRVIIGRQATENLLGKLAELDTEGFDAETKRCWKSVATKTGGASLRSKLLKGVALDEELAKDMLATEKMTVAKGWCGLEVTMLPS